MQEGKRDWVTVIEVVAGTGKVLAPLVIHSSTAHLMGHHSNINYGSSQDAFFAHLKAGYTSTEVVRWELRREVFRQLGPESISYRRTR